MSRSASEQRRDRQRAMAPVIAARKNRAAQQKAAREALAYDDAPGRMTADDLVAYHRQLKQDCLDRLTRRAA